MPSPFRLGPGSPAPVQQSPTTCASACLTVARMHVDGDFDRWVRFGVAPGTPASRVRPEAAGAERRFASCEREVVVRTNGLLSAAGRLQLPWPRALGTPPWGAAREMERRGSVPGHRYRTTVVRWRTARGRSAAYDELVRVVRPGVPALLYVGSPTLPRHVVLVLGAAEFLTVYEPFRGQVHPVTREDLVHRRLQLGGWSTPWFLVRAV